jgi:AHBA synthesis associated protein
MPAPPRGLRAVLFDLDGTLLDSFQSHLEIYQATLAGFGIALTAADFRRHYSPDWNEFYQRVGLRREDWDAASASWLREAAAHRPKPFAGVAATLGTLRKRFRLGLVTSGSLSRVRADLERGAIVEYFDVVVTADDVREPKPAPDGLRVALTALGLAAHQALYVGDTDADCAFARAADVAFVGVKSAFSQPGAAPGYLRLAGVGELPGFLDAG